MRSNSIREADDDWGAALEQAIDYRLERFSELAPEMLPAAWIRKVDEWSLPLRAHDRVRHVSLDGAEQGCDHVGLKSGN